VGNAMMNTRRVDSGMINTKRVDKGTINAGVISYSVSVLGSCIF
jgi:hypothetical protein